jgi:hypothetical protein
MLDDVELRELRIFLAVLVAAMRETGAQRPGAGVRAGCPLPWPASPPAAGTWPPGRTRPSTGQPGQARVRYAAALGLASQIGGKYQQARAHNGLGHAFHATGDPGQAHRHWQEALALYTDLGGPEVTQIRAQLIAADEDTYPEHR